MLEAMSAEGGPDCVKAEGSVWRLYFPAGLTPTEDQVRDALGALGGVQTKRAGDFSYVEWDTTADGVKTDVVNFSGASIIDHKARAETVDNARRAEAFNERVMLEAERLVDNRIIEIEAESREEVKALELAASRATERAMAAEGSLVETRQEVRNLRTENIVLKRAADNAGVTDLEIEHARDEVAEKPTLLPAENGPIVEDVGSDVQGVTNVEFNLDPIK